MNKIVRVAVATGFALAACLYASASMATNTREAIKACDANPKCSFDVGKDGVVISVGGNLIVCPIKNGPCGVSRQSHLPTDFSGMDNGLQFQSAN